MLSRFSLLAVAAFALAGCSMFSHHSKSDAAPAHQALMKSITGDIRYALPHPVPADAYLLVTLADVSRQDVTGRTIAEERVEPVTASPVDFLISYDPSELKDGVDFAISVRLQQGDKLLAINDTRVSVLGRSGENGPVSVMLKPVP
ncbi:YbaY family lipoprotein [Dyella halodurans]|uniref:YbaY family lipoprotein n=1 Tax=Dyella halodurans TaxID=1920171 RepID=A0ABV9C5P5_9GAMM|nr:YbaY family lipoprotein [Dyella halodurans]